MLCLVLRLHPAQLAERSPEGIVGIARMKEVTPPAILCLYETILEVVIAAVVAQYERGCCG